MGQDPYYEGYARGQQEAMAHFKQVPSGPQYVRVDSGGEHHDQLTVGAHSVTLDYKTAAMVILTMLGAIWWGSQQFSSLQYELRDLSRNMTTLPQQFTQQIKLMGDAIGERMTRVEAELSARTASRWTRADHQIWCLKTEAENQQLGWRCAQEPHAESAPRVRGKDTDVQPFDYYRPQNWDTQSVPSKGPQQEARN